jgi:hypothetical protein
MSILWDMVKFIIYSFLLLTLGFLMGVQASVDSSRQEVVVIEDCRGVSEDVEKSY